MEEVFVVWASGVVFFRGWDVGIVWSRLFYCSKGDIRFRDWDFFGDAYM